MTTMMVIMMRTMMMMMMIIMMMVQVRGNVFWVQLVTGRRGKVTDKKSHFDQV